MDFIGAVRGGYRAGAEAWFEKLLSPELFTAVTT